MDAQNLVLEGQVQGMKGEGNFVQNMHKLDAFFCSFGSAHSDDIQVFSADCKSLDELQSTGTGPVGSVIKLGA